MINGDTQTQTLTALALFDGVPVRIRFVLAVGEAPVRLVEFEQEAREFVLLLCLLKHTRRRKRERIG